LKITLN